MSVLIDDMPCPEGVWIKITPTGLPVALRVHNKGVATVMLKKSLGAPSNTGGAIPLAAGASREAEDIAVWGLDVWALSPWRDGLLAIEALITGGGQMPAALSILDIDFSPLTTGLVVLPGASGLTFSATASGASLVLTAALSSTLPSINTPPVIDWIPDATGVAEPLVVSSWGGLARRGRTVAAFLNTPSAGTGSVRVRLPDGGGGWVGMLPSTAAVYHLSAMVAQSGASSSEISAATAMDDVFNLPSLPSLTMAVATVDVMAANVDPAPVLSGAGSLTLAHLTGGSEYGNGAHRHWSFEAAAAAEIATGVVWADAGGGALSRITVVAA